MLAEAGKLKKTVKGIERIIGINVKANCKKNKIGLPFRKCDYPVYFGYGIDDIEASLDFLTTCKELSSISEELGLGYVDKVTPQAKARFKKDLEDPDFAKSIRKTLDRKIVEIWREVEDGFIPKAKKY